MRRSEWVLMGVMGWAVVAHAGGPRFVTGTVGYTAAGTMMAFRTARPLYFTDAGALSSSVTHAQADAMVAAAAGVWNVPSAALVLAQGGVLAEHVDGGNTYFGAGGVVFPRDVTAANYLAVPIAVVYDSDGSVTDLLLGEGASAPAGCRSAGVTESVDGFGATGTIDHAVIVLNGRCVGATPESLLQMQYRVMRAFGRVLGLAWAQVNDNVFTGVPTPTAVQMAHWPVMHPLDVICGAYAYQCMVNPFVLREDDVSSLALLYPVTAANVSAGKVLTLGDAVEAGGHVLFPTIQGMELANVTVRRLMAGHPERETWETAGTVAGMQFQADGGNPVGGGAGNSGSGNMGWEGVFKMARVPVTDDSSLFLTVGSINPLYVGDAALGPYERAPVAISGAGMTTAGGSFHPGNVYNFDLVLGDAAPVCAPGNDGLAWSPVAADGSGWWSGQACSVGHVGWWSAAVKAGHSWTMEVTALDDSGAASVQKMQPVVGVWRASDATGTVPSVARAAMAMNGLAVGMTRVLVPAGVSDGAVRIAVADQFGAGRPDFRYRARLLYAGSVTPVMVAGGATIKIAGSGFRRGNRVLVNGVGAAVSSWSATEIVAAVPSFAAVGKPSNAVDVAVVDVSTGGVTTMAGALTYTATDPVRKVVMGSTSQYVAAGASAGWSVSLTALEDGAAAVGVPVVWTGSAGLAVQGSGVTGAGGVAGVVVQASAVAAGSASVLTGCVWGSVCASWTLYGVDASLWRVAVVSGAGQSVGVGSVLSPVGLVVTDVAGHTLQGAGVAVYQAVRAWEGVCVGRCAAAPVMLAAKVELVSDAGGGLVVTPMQVAGVAQVLSVAAAAGAEGFVALGLVVGP